ncbi:MAG: DUF1501 domain-containing protein, partial [Planctomycetales bacterium]|nr:DUF1501 domain-containing protein [Planctomycetales bacterium]NIP85985.1 DUF1501 domain-containing protein [Planctomycetales bacterium]
GPFQPIATRAPDIQVSEILPRHATVADKFSLVRSCYHTGPPVHEAGWQLLQTGRLADPGMPAPHVGAVAASLSQPARRRTPHVILPAPVRPSGGTPPADLSAVSPDPTCLGCNPSFDPVATNHRPPTHQPLRHIGAVPLPPRQRLRDTIEAHLQQFEADRQPDLGDDHFQIAYRLLASRPVREAMALSGEAPPVRQRYGRSRFGQSCLLARRLIEAGVRFVTVNTFLSVHDQLSWDVHGRHAFPTLKDMQNQVAPMYDQ